MKPYSEMTKEELLELKRDLSDQYREFQGKNLTLDMSCAVSQVQSSLIYRWE